MLLPHPDEIKPWCGDAVMSEGCTAAHDDHISGRVSPLGEQETDEDGRQISASYTQLVAEMV